LVQPVQYAILVLRSTARRGRRADARGASGLRTLFRLHFTLSFTNFHVFYFLPLIFFYPKILCQNISPSFLSQNLLMDFFWLLNFCLQKKFCTPTFLSKIYRSQNILIQILRNFLFRNFFFHFFLKTLLKIVCISLVNFLFV
jgi:hypothetical protein